MKKKFASALLAAGLVWGATAQGVPATAQAATAELTAVNFTVIVEDKQLTVDPQPFVVENRTFVPLRALSEGLGADVQYDPNTNIATITKEDIVLQLNFNTGVVTKNGVQIEIKPAPRFVNNRTMVPVRFISEAFGNEVKWDPTTSTVMVLPTEKTLAKRAAIRAVLTKSTEVSNAQEYMTLDMKMNGSIPSPLETITIEGPLWLQYSKNPLAVSMGATIKSAMFNETLGVEVYVMDGYMYLKNPQTGQWEKAKLSEAEWQSMLDATRTGGVPATNEAVLNVMLPYMTMTEDEDSYNVTLKLDKNGLDKLIQSAGELQQPGLPPVQPLSDMPAGSKLSFVTHYEIDKKTYLQNNLAVNFEVEVPEQGTMKFGLTGTMSYGKVQVNLPQEAKEAKEVDTL
jgi:hypothetical protein